LIGPRPNEPQKQEKRLLGAAFTGSSSSWPFAVQELNETGELTKIEPVHHEITHQLCQIRSNGPPTFGISTQQQNGGQMEEPSNGLIQLDKYPLRQYLVDQPDPERRHILHPSDIKIVDSRTQNAWTKDQLSSISTGMAGWPDSSTPIL
jgi:hypothetical protein